MRSFVVESRVDAPPEIDPLQKPRELADSDAHLARRAATAAPPALVAALTQIAAERTQHARALVEEIAREAGEPLPTPTATATTTPPGSATATPQAGEAPSVADVVAALRSAADNAADLAAGQSGYRAGLLASIAAACTASFTVTLPTPKAAS